MKYILRLLLVILLTNTILFAESFQKPPYDNRLDRYPNSTEWYNHADTDSASAFNIGLIYQMKIQNLAKAEFWYKQALSIDSNNTDAIINLGVICEDTKKYEEAIKWYEKADLLGKVSGSYNLAILYEHLHNYNNAIKWYQKSIKRERIDALKGLSLMYYKKLHNKEKAVEYFIPLIDNRYPKEKVLAFFKQRWKLSDKTIKKGYEAQLKSTIIPEKLKYKGGI